MVELVIAVVIVGVLAALALPNMSQMIRSHRLTAQVNDWVADLNFARSEAIKRAANVAICAGSQAGGCTGTWNSGRIVFLDADASNAWTAGEAVVRSRDALESGYGLTAAGTVIVFTGTGAAAAGSGTYVFCHNGVAATGKQVSVNILGQVSTLKTSPGSC
jgi:type IV fimbrial biogenesis protein FimT